MKNSKLHDIDKPKRGAYNKQWYIDKRTGGTCEVCDVRYPVDVMEFHHIVPSEKLFEVKARYWATVKPSQRTLDEASKCVILCSNCHKLEHVALKRGESIINDKEAYSRYRDHRVTYNGRYESVVSGDDGLYYTRGTQLSLPL